MQNVDNTPAKMSVPAFRWNSLARAKLLMAALASKAKMKATNTLWKKFNS